MVQRVVKDMNTIISFTSDFGQSDEYVAAVKAVILSICPKATIVDITHNIPPQDILKAALVLDASIKFFPPNSFHLVVVDPGVGSERNIILIKTTKNKFLVGPDNGVLYPVAKREGIVKIIKFTNTKYCLPNISDTFHGRDIMGPIVAHLANGEPLDDFGEEIEDIVKLKIEQYTLKDNEITGTIIAVDRFGNLITSIPNTILEKIKINSGESVKVVINKKKIRAPLMKYFSEVNKGEFLLYKGSKGLLELAVNAGSAAKKSEARTGEKIKLIL
ncbi:MAG: SAM hydrolase/SAM-dependent halogenase family protein [Candidatus Odinarchaeia archaeon]